MRRREVTPPAGTRGVPAELAHWNPSDWTVKWTPGMVTGPGAEMHYKRRLYYDAIIAWCTQRGLLNKWGTADWRAFARACPESSSWRKP